MSASSTTQKRRFSWKRLVDVHGIIDRMNDPVAARVRELRRCRQRLFDRVIGFAACSGDKMRKGARLLPGSGGL